MRVSYLPSIWLRAVEDSLSLPLPGVVSRGDIGLPQPWKRTWSWQLATKTRWGDTSERRSAQPQKPVCAPNTATCNGHTCSLQQHQTLCRQRQTHTFNLANMQSTHCCLLLAALLNKPCGRESERAAQIKTPTQLVQKHLKHKHLTTRNVFVYVCESGSSWWNCRRWHSSLW